MCYGSTGPRLWPAEPGPKLLPNVMSKPIRDKKQDEETSTQRPCPICGKPAAFAYRPFCSKRCADIDLHRWLSGAYALPAAPEAEDDEALPEAEEQGSKERG